MNNYTSTPDKQSQHHEKVVTIIQKSRLKEIGPKPLREDWLQLATGLLVCDLELGRPLPPPARALSREHVEAFQARIAPPHLSQFLCSGSFDRVSAQVEAPQSRVAPQCSRECCRDLV